MCVPRNPFESAQTARFNNPKVLSLLQTMSSIVLPCRRGCPAGMKYHKYICRQRTTAPALRPIRTTTRHTLHARVPCRSPHPSPMHPWRLRGGGGGRTRKMAPKKRKTFTPGCVCVCVCVCVYVSGLDTWIWHLIFHKHKGMLWNISMEEYQHANRSGQKVNVCVLRACLSELPCMFDFLVCLALCMSQLYPELRGLTSVLWVTVGLVACACDHMANRPNVGSLEVAAKMSPCHRTHRVLVLCGTSRQPVHAQARGT